MNGKLATGVGSQYPSHYIGTWCIQHYYRWWHTSAASSRLNLRPRWFRWTRPFRRKTKSGFCACAITFQTQSNKWQAVVKMAVNLLVAQCKCAVPCTFATSICIPLLAVIKSLTITVIVSEVSLISLLLISLLRICYLGSEVWKAEWYRCQPLSALGPQLWNLVCIFMGNY